MKKLKKILLLILSICIACYLVMFMTDYIRSSLLKEPIFTLQIASYDDGGSGTYQGLGYKIEVKVMNPDSRKIAYVKMYMFGRLIVDSNE